MKDFVPQSLRSGVVYKFQCASCNACYIGETTRHLYTYPRTPCVPDKSSHIYKHLQESESCNNSCSAESFTILDCGTSKFQIKIKEALYMKWDNPSLKRQLKKFYNVLLDIDECQNSSACRSDYVCNNTVGSYRCECRLGYVEHPSSQNVMEPICVGKEIEL